ncbi:MAG: hypothetical protein NC453_12905 [Muribaculum sp.]|nr:hypothetical protein [Muribaculum sp.]
MEYSDAFKESFRPEVINNIKTQMRSDMKKSVGDNGLDIAAGFIPIVGALKAKTSFQSYKDYRMGEKILKFLEAFANENYNPEQLNDMIEDIQEKNGEHFFETLIDTIDRIDNINKTEILANILNHSISGEISHENFLRHSWILTNIPYIDLAQLHKYTKDFYQTASTEILASNGLVNETILDAGTYGDNPDESGGSKYGLSPLGEEMLRYGLKSTDWQYQGSGRVIPSLEWKEIE